MTMRRTMLTLLTTVLAGALLLPAAATAETAQIFVATWGKDSWPGTFDRPYATVARAQREVRARTAEMTADLVVNLRGGTYRLARPVELSAAEGDSGQRGHRVIYQAHGCGTRNAEQVTLSGGRQITEWHRGDRGVWQAEVGDLDTRQLYVNGRRATRAALGAGLPGPLTITDSGYVVPGTAPQSWANPADIELVYRGGFDKGTWAMAETRCGVAGISGDTTQTTITMDQPCFRLANEMFSLPLSGGPPRLGDPTDVENSPSLLRTPGSFYLDRARPGHHVLSYLPRPGEDLHRTQVVAPVLETLVHGRGAPGSPLHDITLRGLTFAHATWLAPNEPAGFPSAWSMYARPNERLPRTVPGNVVFHSAERITLEGNRFRHLGAQALEISQSSSHNVVRGNVISDVSDGGILLGVVLPDLTGTNRGNRIENNWIHDIGVEYHGGSGIWALLTHDTTIAHNQINDTPYSGILSGPGEDVATSASNNRIVNNLVFRAMRTLDDGGGIYLRGGQGSSFDDGAVVSGNVVHSGRTDDPDAHFNLGIYTDDTINWVTLRRNVIYDYLGSIGGCADPYIKNLRYRANFWDDTVPPLVPRRPYPGAWVCGDPENLSFAGNTLLPPLGPDLACGLDPACAGIVADAGLQPRWRGLLRTG